MENVKKIILVVEDDSSYRRILKEKLEGEGFEVLAAQNGEEGMSMALEHHPDLIILDLVMPQMNGLEVIKTLRTDPWGRNAKIIILTVLEDSQKVAEAVANETFDYYVKTEIKVEELVGRIKEKLGIK
jgi:two-component system alkaline phosphatase synthesis response regulator PhoP